MTIEFTVPGRPVPVGRPRVTRFGTYTPKESQRYKKDVALFASEAMRGKEPFGGAVSCEITLCFAIPKSYTKGKRLACEHNIIKPTGSNWGDADNLAKGVMDGMTGICWADDKQVTRLVVRKRFGKEDYAIIVLTDDDLEVIHDKI